MKSWNREKFEKVKLIGIVLFCIAVGSGGAKGFIDKVMNKEEITLSYQEELRTIESIEETKPVTPSSSSEDDRIEADKEISTKININSADSQKLQTLKGIGPTKAESIIKYRDDYGGFTAIEEITEVKGIGAATFLKIKEHITI